MASVQPFTAGPFDVARLRVALQLISMIYLLLSLWSEMQGLSPLALLDLPPEALRNDQRRGSLCFLKTPSR